MKKAIPWTKHGPACIRADGHWSCLHENPAPRCAIWIIYDLRDSAPRYAGQTLLLSQAKAFIEAQDPYQEPPVP